MSILKASVLAMAMTTGAAHAATIYSEDFTGQEDKGAIGATTDTSGVDWTLDLGDAALLNDSDFAAVVSAEQFQFRDTNAGCINSSCTGTSGDPISDYVLPMWLSPIVDISTFTSLMVQFDYGVIGNVESTGGVNSEDDLIFSVLLDGIETLLLDVITSPSGADDLAGSFMAALGDAGTFQLKVTGNTYASTERVYFDNVILTGEEVAPVPLPASLPLLALALGGVGLARARRG